MTESKPPSDGVLMVRLKAAEAAALAKLAKRLSRSKIKQFRLADTNDEARQAGLALTVIGISLEMGGFCD